MPPLLAAPIGAAVLALRLAAATATATPAEARSLEPGKPVERALSAGETHVYEILLARGQYLRVAVEQRGIDVISTLTDPAGQAIIVLDGPTGDFGVELLDFVAERAGVHRISVRSFSRLAAPGRYAIRVVERRPAGATDAKRDRACRLFARAYASPPDGLTPAAWSRQKLEIYRRAAGLWSEIGQDREAAAAWIEFGNATRSLGDLKAGADAAEKAIGLAVRAGDPQLECKARTSLAVTRALQGNSRGALEVIEPAIAIARRIGDRQSLADALHAAAWGLYTQGRYQEALDDDREALATAEAIGYLLGQAWACNGIGNNYAAIGEAARSLAAYDRAVDLFRRVENQQGLAFTLQSEGYLAWKIGAERKALALFQESLPLNVAASNRQGEAFARNNIGLALLTLGELATARAELSRALALWEQAGDAHGRALSLHNMGRVFQREGNTARAIELYEKALAAFRATGDRHGEARVLATMAEAEAEASRLDAALSRIDASLSLFDSLGRSLATPSLRSAFISSKQDAYGIAVDVLARLDAARPGEGFGARAFQASERSRARELLESVTEARLDLSSELPEDLRRRQVELSDRLTSLQKKAAAGRLEHASAEASLARAEEEWEQLVAEIRRRTPRYAALRYPEPIALPAALALVGRDSAVVSFEVLRDRTLVFVLSSGALRIVPVPLPQVRLTELVEGCVGLMSRPGMPRGDAVCRRLAGEVIEPWRSRLPVGARHLIVVPDGALSALPIEALPDAAAPGRPLLDSWTVSYAPSVTLLGELARLPRDVERPPSDLLVFAAPVLPAALARRDAEIEGERFDLAPLPAAEEEARAVARYGGPGTMVSVGTESSEARLKREPLERFAGLHFATHAVLNPLVPSRSALVLAAGAAEKEDGLLQAREIYSLRLKSDLVVLSGCRTASGRILPGEGVEGLAQAFFHAGARTLVASLWDVSDRRTADLMEAFYRHLALGESKADALRSAKLDLLRADPGLAPHFWAPFVLIGEPAGTVPLRAPSWWRRLFS